MINLDRGEISAKTGQATLNRALFNKNIYINKTCLQWEQLGFPVVTSDIVNYFN